MQTKASLKDRIQQLSRAKLELFALSLEQKLHALQAAAREPIAIVGLACRFPGGCETPEEFWKLLVDGRDGISDVPADRWDNAQFYDADASTPGTIATRFGGFVADVFDFDPAVFGIGKREAAVMDPQQRILLETAWQAMERAGYCRETLSQTRTGVYVGAFASDFARRFLDDDTRIDGYSGTGTALSPLAGRLSHLLGLRGPSMVIDTACSSSLVALHQACRSLRERESDLAFAAGVNLLLSPEWSIAFSKAGMLARDGRCKSFDAAADGYVRSEGCGVVVLKRLAEAERDGDPVWAVIRGSAVNQDGESQGLTAPNGAAQQELLRAALNDAGIEPQDLQYLEAHGTGTPLGDPIEVNALAAVLTERVERAQPLVLGSVKASIGHAEAAAGMAGLLKVVLALKHEVIPAQIHFRATNPLIDLPRLNLAIAREARAWKRGSSARRAGVSSFGFSGTNAHAIIEEAPLMASVTNDIERPQHLLCLSAQTAHALDALIARYVDYLGQTRAPLADICHTAAVGRSHFTHRATVRADSVATLRSRLEKLASGDRTEAGSRGETKTKRGTIAFLFPGQGAQWAGMGKTFYETQPVFRSALDRCNERLQSALGVSLAALLWGEAAEKLNDTRYTQPALFALEYALGELWMSFGIRPGVLLGHSIGEYAAACLAGVFSLEDACTMIEARARLMSERCALGGMLAVRASEPELAAHLNAYSAQLSIAAVNGPRSVVVAGERDALSRLEASLARAAVKSVRLNVSHGFHSVQMTPMLKEFEAIARTLRYHAPRWPIISTVTGDEAGEAMATPTYWVRHVGSPVRFHAAVQTLADKAIGACLELGPDATLLGMSAEIVSDASWRALASLRRAKDAWDTCLDGLATLYVDGVDIDWAGVDKPYRRRRVDLPTYPFQRERFSVAPATRRSAAVDVGEHPLLGHRRVSPHCALEYQNKIDAERPSYLADHCVHGAAIFPAAAFVEMAMSAAAEQCTGDALALENFVIAAPLLLSEKQPLDVHTSVERTDDGVGVTIQSLDGSPWRLNAQASVFVGHRVIDAEAKDVVKTRCRQTIERAAHYRALSDMGLAYGAAFQALDTRWDGNGEAFADVTLPVEAGDAAAYRLHPVILDAALQVGVAVVASDRVYLPVSIDRFTYLKSPGMRAGVHVRRREQAPNDGEAVLDAVLYDDAGTPCVEVHGLRLRRAERQQLLRSRHARDCVYELAWRERAIGTREATRGRCWIVGDPGALCAAVVKQLTADGIAVDHAASLDSFAGADAPSAVVYLHDWDRAQASTDPADVERQCDRALRFVQTLARRGFAARLLWVTRQSQSVTGFEPIDPEQAALWGLAAVVENEHPEMMSRRLDLDAAGDVAVLARAIGDELQSADADSQIAYRAGARYVARLSANRAHDKSERPLPNGPFAVRLRAYGELDHLELALKPRRAPARGEIEVAVRAASLNFKEMLFALGMLPAHVPARASDLVLGFEYAGYVAAVGEGVSDFKIGDAVVGAVPGSLASHVTVGADTVFAAPPGLTLEQAAALPTVFMTAYYALIHCAKLKAGERVLIHAAAGGVGQAALQVARAIGAEVCVTANPAKWEFLRSQGGTYLYIGNSRDLVFAEQIPAATGGKGVDVVLNSLNGEFIPKSFDVLAQGGRFVELGKKGIWSSEEAKRHRPDVDYRHFDWGDIAREQPALYRDVFQAVLAGIAARRYRALPVQTYPVEAIVGAFRQLAQAKHLGKIVIRFPALRDTGEADYELIGPQRRYLVTGGTGALGLLLARHLVERGARHLLLTARRAPGAEVQAQIDRLRERGADVQIAQVDVTDRRALENVFTELHAATPPLGGVIHAAGVLDDGILTQQDGARFARVLAPKAAGASHLDALTRDAPLDFFICFSSVSALLGAAGQGNYAAANAYLDALMQRRRQQGSVGLSIAWGAWAEGGMAARLNERDRARFNKSGFGVLEPDVGLAAFDWLLPRAGGYRIVMPVDWAAVQRNADSARAPALFQEVWPAAASSAKRDGKQALTAALSSARPEERRALLTRYVQETVAARLNLENPAVVGARKRLFDLGVDSLVSVELRNIFQKDLHHTLATTVMLDYPSVEALAEYFLSGVLKLDDGSRRDAEAPVKSARETAASLSEQVGHLSEQEVEALMLERLKELDMDKVV
jgi:acyl transferase domain-containing protein